MYLFLFNVIIVFVVASCAVKKDDTPEKEGTWDGKTEERVIYGDDDRKDFYQVSDGGLKSLALSTVALVQNSDLQPSGSQYRVLADSFGVSRGLCSNEPFYDQPAGAFCSGSLVGEDLIMTAGHCVTSAGDCANVSFVFRYHVAAAGIFPTLVAASDVFRCKEIVTRKQESAGADYAIIRLDRKVVGYTPLRVRRSGAVSVGDSLTVIGHPSGLPTKIADGGRVRKVDTSFFVSNLDTYGGNSGSAVFNSQTREIEGILVRGETDFARQGSCTASYRCSGDGCRGEDVTRVDQVLAFIPEVKPPPDPSPTPTPPPPSGRVEFANVQAAVIPDKNVAGITSNVTANVAPNGAKVLVQVDVDHTYIGDLEITLIDPQGSNYVLHKHTGGRTRNIRGVYGESLLALSDLGKASQVRVPGVWKLKVADTLQQDVGTLKSWKLIFVK